MRKLKLQVQMSVDGFIAGPKGELDWLIRDWDNEIKKYVYNLTRPVDCIVLGKNLAHVFIDSWEKRLNDPSTADSFARKMVDTPKIVFSRSLRTLPWKNTRLANGDLAEEINRLKLKKGRDIIVYGGATFAASLINAGLIDEFNIFINPVALGKGIPLFRDLESQFNMDLVYSTSFDCGITALCYLPSNRTGDKESLTVISDSEECK